MQLAQTLRRSALLYPERVALVDGDVRHDWRTFEARVARLAGALRAWGVVEGDRVAILANNSHRYIEAFFAAFWSGAIAVPVNTRWAPAEVRHALEDSGARVLVVDPEHLEAGRAQFEQAGALERLVLAADADVRADGVEHWEDMIAHAPVDDAGRGGEDLACLFYTGGTTGRSKGVMLTHANIVANSMAAMINMGIRSDTVHLHTSPMFHVAGGARLFSVTLAGGTHVVIPRFDVDAFLDVIERERVTITIIVPTMLARLVRHPDLETRNLSSLRLLSYGASPMPEAVLREAMARLPHVSFLQSYGMTELSPVATVLGPEHHTFEGPLAGRTASAGRPVYNADVMIVDEDGRPLPTGEVGEVCVRGPMVMKGYWNLPELTAETLRGGWMHTGDAGYLDPEGFLFIVDRLKDMIVSGGENVYSAEVEDALYLHPDVLECAVIGIPDERWGETVHAVVVPRPGTTPDPDALVAHCRERIAHYKCPRSVEIRTAELPKSGPGKILKTELRAPFWDGRGRAVN